MILEIEFNTVRGTRKRASFLHVNIFENFHLERGRNTKGTALDIANIIAEHTGKEVSEIKPESTFSELGIDSLDTVDLLMNVEAI